MLDRSIMAVMLHASLPRGAEDDAVCRYSHHSIGASCCMCPDCLVPARQQRIVCLLNWISSDRYNHNAFTILFGGSETT